MGGHVLQCIIMHAFQIQGTGRSLAGLLYLFKLLISLHVSCCCPPQLVIYSSRLQAPSPAQGAAESVSSHTSMHSGRGKAWIHTSWKGPREDEAKCITATPDYVA